MKKDEFVLDQNQMIVIMMSLNLDFVRMVEQIYYILTCQYVVPKFFTTTIQEFEIKLSL